MTNPYQTPSAEVDYEEAEPEYAGFWVRLVASIIDSIWLIVLAVMLGWFVYGDEYFNSTEISKGVLDVVINYVLPLVLTVLFWIYRSATPGKMALGIKIVDAKTFKAAKPQQLVLRYVGYYVSTVIFFLGFLWVIWDSKKQGWHDKIAQTLVVKN